MKKITNWFNGKKTIISSIISLFIAFLYGKGIIDINTATFLGSLSILLLGVGLTHKAMKFKNKPLD